MKSHLSIFEVPVNDMSRAIDFYQKVMGIKIERHQFDEMEIGLMPYEGQLVTGVLIKGQDYTPSNKGVTIYLNAGDDLQEALDKVSQNNGVIIIPKTPHADGQGFFAIFLDSEGNRLGLHSPN